MLPIVAFDNAIALGTPCRLPDISTTSAASIAMSVPVPMARPTSASAKAGASLIPSPTKATLPYCSLRRRTASTLPSGNTSAATVPPTAGITAKLFGTRYLATLFGLTLLSHQIGGFLGAWLGGIAVVTTGNYDWMWWADAVLAVLAAVVNLPIKEAAPVPKHAVAA